MGKQEAEADPWQVWPCVKGDGVQDADLGVSRLDAVTPKDVPGALEFQLEGLDGISISAALDLDTRAGEVEALFVPIHSAIRPP
jgi:hypothetical protein